jgi:shikimate dehydrogenase
MGWPVNHSLSPQLHSFWLRELDIRGYYLPLAVQPKDLARALWSLPVLGFRGVNLTVPHKEHAIHLVDEVAPIAAKIGAVNTVTVGEDGSLHGTNTDALGFIENLRAGAPGWQPVRPTLVIGAGGAARAVCIGLLEVGAAEVRVCNRTRTRSDELAREIDGNVLAVDWSDREVAVEEAGLLVNTTTLGMRGSDPLRMSLDRLPTDAVVSDIVYVPLETPLLTAAKHRGNTVVDGLGMLLYQAQPGFLAWFGQPPKVTAAVRAHLGCG